MTDRLVDRVNEAIENLRPSFQADDFDIALASLSATGEVVIAIEAGPGACLDCLMPDPMLQQVVDGAVRRYAPDAASVTILKRGFENLESPG